MEGNVPHPSIDGLIAEQASRDPTAVAVEDERTALTYGELLERADAIAERLRGEGVRSGDLVAVYIERSAAAVASLLGILRAGAAYLPLDPADPPARHDLLIEDAKPSAVLPLEPETAQPAAPRESEPGGERLAYVIYTSGSTGIPKGVEVTHANVLTLLHSGSDVVPIRGDSVLQVSPLNFDFSVLEIWGALVHGARLVVVPPGRPDPRAVARLIREKGVTYAGITAGVFARIVEDAIDDLAGLRVAVPGADVLPPATARAFRAAHPHIPFINAYGPTETTVLCTTHEVGEVDGAIPVGRAVPGYELRILDPDGNPTDDGELWIGGPSVTRGYRGNPEATAEKFVDGWYRSGDRIRRDAEGVLHFVGRLDKQVKIGGVRIEPGEVEHVLAAHPDVAQSAVVVRTAVEGHPQLMAYAAPRPGAALDADALRAHLAERLPATYVPPVVVVLDVLPLTERGKVDRDTLPEPEAGPGVEAASDADAVTVLVAATMGGLLGRAAPGPDDDFFALGGDSLLAIALVGRLRAAGHPELSVGSVFSAPTPRRLAAALDAPADAAALPPMVPRERCGPLAPLTAAQRRAWLFQQLNPSSRAYQFAALVRLDGELDTAALRAALQDLVARHEALRSSVTLRDGQPMQHVHDTVALPLDEVDLRGAPAGEFARAVRTRVRRSIDVGQAPWVRWTLLRLDEERWALLSLEHHLGHDGWSLDVLVRELGALYAHHRDGTQPPPLPALQIGDVGAWEEANAEALDVQLDHWEAVLDRDPAPLRLPLDRPRPARESFDGGLIRHRLAPSTSRDLQALAEQEGATLFQACLAAFAVQLARYDGREDLQIGSGVANRGDPGLAGTLGMTVNTVALRVDLSGDPTVRELLRRVRDVAVDALAHADVPFDRVVERLAPPRDPSRSPLVGVLFSFHDAPRAAIRWSGLDQVRVVGALPDGTAKAELNVIGVREPDGSVGFVWEHGDSLTDATTARLAGHHEHLLSQFAAQPDAPALGLALEPEEEAARREARSQAPARHDPAASLPGVVAEIVAANPAAVAVAGPDGALTYGDLWERAGGLAAALRAAGAGPGDRVGLALPRGTDAIVAHLAVARAGAIVAALDLDHPAARRASILAAAGACAVVAASEEDAAGVALVVPDATAPDPGDLDRAGPGDAAQINFTSGSTGSPKGVVVTHENILRLVQDCGFADLGDGAVVLHAASPAFDATTLEVWGPLANGGTVVPLAQRPDPDAVAAAVAEHGVTTLWLTAGLFHALVDQRPDALARVRHVLAGGDVVSPEHVARALAALPPDGRFTNGYGPTEGTTFTTTWTPRRGEPVPAPLPIGWPVQGSACHVMDARGRPVPDGVEGELWIGGAGVSDGYWEDPELTAQRFVAGPGGRCYRSGDRVRRRPADGALEFLGRADAQLKIRGVRVEPAEVEAVLRGHPGVADAVVVAPQAGDAGDRRLVAYLVARPGAPAPSPASLRVYVAARLPAAMVPAAWVRMPALPLTANGKVARELLPEPTREHYARAGNGGSHQQAGPHERLVIAAFETVLDLRPVEADDDFFALGGHSLLALALCAEVRRLTGSRVEPATIFAAPTPRALAATLVEAPTNAGRWSTLVELRREGTRPPLYVITAGDGNPLAFAAMTRRLDPDQPVYALQPRGLDGRSPFDRTIPALAARYLAEVRRIQPHGPYVIAGRCNGATVAYAMAAELRADGEEVALVAALDSEPPQVGPAEIVPGLRRDRIVDVAIGAARREGAGVPIAGPALREWLREQVAPGVTRYLAAGRRLRPDLCAAFPDPDGDDAVRLAAWAWSAGIREGLFEPELLVPGAGPAGPTPYMLAIHALRPDLQQVFPDPLGADAASFIAWAWTDGVREYLVPELLGPAPDREAHLALIRTRSRRRAAVTAAPLPVRSALLAAGRGLLAAERHVFGELPGRDERLMRAVRAAAKEARAAWWAEPSRGRFLHIRSAEHANNPLMDGWWALALEGVREVPLAAAHVGMLREPDAAHTAAVLQQAIDAAIGHRHALARA